MRKDNLFPLIHCAEIQCLGRFPLSFAYTYRFLNDKFQNVSTVVKTKTKYCTLYGLKVIPITGITGNAKKMKNNCTSGGVERINSIDQVTIQLNGLMGILLKGPNKSNDKSKRQNWQM